MKNHPILNIAMVEFDPKWLKVDQNLRTLEGLKFSTETELIILPEMFATGFCMNATELKPEDGKDIVEWMKNFSNNSKKAIAGSVAIYENQKFYNRFYFCENGEVKATYDKRHLFTYSGEDKYYKSGTEKVIFEFKGWKICPQICYDLRFPVWFRNTENYDILLNVANWPVQRIHIWSNLLQARSIENMCYTIGVNRHGVDGNNLDYNGCSNVCFPSAKKTELLYHDSIINTTLDYYKLKTYREKYPFLKDQDEFKLNHKK